MKQSITTTLLAAIFLLSLNSCARYYGIKKPIATPEKPHIANKTTAVNEDAEIGEITIAIDELYEEIETNNVLKNDAEPIITLVTTPKVENENTFKEITAPQQEYKIVSTAYKSANSDARVDGFAVAGFVTSLVSLFIAGIILGSIAIIFSAIALMRINKSDGTKRGRGLAIAGLIIGIVGVVLTAILLLAIL